MVALCLIYPYFHDCLLFYPYFIYPLICLGYRLIEVRSSIETGHRMN